MFVRVYTYHFATYYHALDLAAMPGLFKLSFLISFMRLHIYQCSFTLRSREHLLSY